MGGAHSVKIFTAETDCSAAAKVMKLVSFNAATGSLNVTCGNGQRIALLNISSPSRFCSMFVGQKNKKVGVLTDVTL